MPEERDRAKMRCQPDVELSGSAPRKKFEPLREVVMNLFDLAKATVVCGGVSFLVYSFPAISQGLIIGLLTVVWVSYAQKLIRRFVQR